MKKCLIFFFLFTTLFPVVAFATTYVSNGSSSNWNTATAWTPNGVPVVGNWPYDNVTINNAITYTGSLTSFSTSAIVVNNGGALTVTGNFTNGNWGSPSLSIASGGTFTVGGLLNLTGADAFSNAGTLNAGTFTIDNGTSTAVTNTGTINVTNNFSINTNRTFTTTAGSISVGGILSLASSAVMNVSNTVINVTGNFNVTASATYSSTGTSLTIGGTMNNTGAVGTVIGGTVSIAGNVNNTGSSNLTFNGATTVAGNLVASGGTKISVNSTTAITGSVSLTGSAYVKGTGTISWGSFTTDASGSNMQCQDGTKFDTDAGSAPTTPGGSSKNLGSSCTILPVQLVLFKVLVDQKNVVLHWTTASEINSSYWLVERSVDGVHFETITQVQAAGNSHSLLNYSFIDSQAKSGINYYRLREVDADGASELFAMKAIDFKIDNGVLRLTAQPTAFDDQVHFSFESAETATYSFEIFDALGQSLYSDMLLANKGGNSLDLNLSAFSSGYYFARITSAQGIAAQIKVLKK